MPKTFRLEVVSPERTLFEADNVIIVTAPGVEGEFGVMANHRPMLSVLRTGVMKVRDVEGEETYMAVTGGFFEVSSNRAIVLCDTAELSTQIDVERAKRSLERALQRLRNIQDRSIDRQRARRAKERALSRLRAAGVRV